MSGRHGWLDCASGVSGDMLLGALCAAGVPLEVMQAAVDAVTPEPVRLTARPTRRGALAATQVDVEGTGSAVHRTWADLRALLDRPGLDAGGLDRARRTFWLLVQAEAEVHGISPDEVHLHEVGMLDAIADVVGVCAGLAHLGLASLTCSPVALGGGTVQAAHGRMAVPGPAVVRLLTAAPTYGGPVDVELTTPTGAALLAAHVTGWGGQPLLSGTRQGYGAGVRDLPGHANVLRLVTGRPWVAPAPGVRAGPEGESELVEVQATVDDLDPRAWPLVLEEAVAAGAADAWLAPVLMRKGRPGHTVHALTHPDRAEAVRAALLLHSSSIGLRWHPVWRRALPRTTTGIEVDGHRIRVKLCSADGVVVHAQPEWEDVAVAATALNRPARWVLARATGAAAQFLGSRPGGGDELL